MSNDCGSVDTEELMQDEEVNCVFCGKLFSSIERIQEHISQCHESVETNTENVELKLDAKLLKVYDLNTELIVNKPIDYNAVIQCSKCHILFVNAYASRMHFEKVHLGCKRKRSSNPNGVEGIIVSPNGSDNWGCDICGRQFPTLKQAKVHKFKSHIEPVQKKDMLIHRNILKKTNASQRNYVKKLIADNKFREILPNSKDLKIDKSQNEIRQSSINDGERSSHSDHNSASGGTGGRPATNFWRAAKTSSRGNKIVISRVYQSEVLLPGNARTKYGFLQKSGHSCFLCREIFLNTENFKRHMLLHRRNQCYKCSSCSSRFHRIKLLKQHQTHHCQRQFVAVKSILEHNGIGTSKPDLSKSQPKTIAQDVCSLKNKTVEEDISAKDIKFAEKFLNNSSITLNKGSQCVCNLCQSCFYSNNSILRHLVLYHRIAAQDGSTALATKSDHHVPIKMSPEKVEVTVDSGNQNSKPTLHFIHNCDQCGSQFASKKGLQRHLHSVHLVTTYDTKHNDSVQADLACSECNLAFNDAQSFEAHKDECLPGAGFNRRVKCDICGRRFRNIVTLEEHKRMHASETGLQSQERNFEMESEGSVFPRLKTDVKVKNRDNFPGGRKSVPYVIPTYKKAKVPPNSDGLFECDVCHKTFTCRSSLSNHVKSHFNFKNKPFSCSSCQQGFMSTLTLQHHREQLCPNINNNNNSSSDANNSAIGSVESVPPGQASLNFESVSQVSGSHNYSSPGADTNSTTYAGNSNLTTRATSCMHCSAMFPDRSLLEDHASKEHSNYAGEVVCIICPRSFTTYMAFRVHMTKSHGGPNGTSLKSHLNTTNSHLKTNTSFEMIQELSTTLKKEHSRPSTVSPNGTIYLSRHACPNCDKDFSTSQALGNHKRACMPHLYKKVSL